MNLDTWKEIKYYKNASLIQSIIRENDQLFRWGGEEFIILLPNTELNSAIQLAYRIQDSIRNSDFSTVKGLTCSFGVTSLKEDDSANSFTERLDQLQYGAKKNGKDRIISDLTGKVLSLFNLGE
jgi:polar amino acid transport system substrate-binding protein